MSTNTTYDSQATHNLARSPLWTAIAPATLFILLVLAGGFVEGGMLGAAPEAGPILRPAGAIPSSQANAFKVGFESAQGLALRPSGKLGSGQEVMKIMAGRGTSSRRRLKRRTRHRFARTVGAPFRANLFGATTREEKTKLGTNETGDHRRMLGLLRGSLRTAIVG